MARRGWSAVVGGRLLIQKAVRHPRGAQDGGDEAGGGPARADIMEVLGGGQRSLVRGERHEGRCPVGSERWLVWRAGP
jgi:hypothetical protein